MLTLLTALLVTSLPFSLANDVLPEIFVLTNQIQSHRYKSQSFWGNIGAYLPKALQEIFLVTCWCMFGDILAHMVYLVTFVLLEICLVTYWCMYYRRFSKKSSTWKRTLNCWRRPSRTRKLPCKLLRPDSIPGPADQTSNSAEIPYSTGKDHCFILSGNIDRNVYICLRNRIVF